MVEHYAGSSGGDMVITLLSSTSTRVRVSRRAFKNACAYAPKVFSLIEACAAVLIEICPPMRTEDPGVLREGEHFFKRTLMDE